MNAISSRLKGGHIYKNIERWKTFRDMFPEEKFFKYILGNERLKSVIGGSRVNEETRLQKKYGKFMKVNSFLLMIPDNKEMALFKHEFVDLLLPTFIKDYNYKTIEPFFIEGPYELNENVCLHSGDVVFDCGANMGVFSAVAATKGCSKVVSFEPSQLIRTKYLDVLSKEYKQITVAPYALSDCIGETVFTYNSINIGASSIMEKNESVDVIEEKVNLITIDEYVKQNHIERVDFIKADIEGAERNMLMGAKYVLQTFAPKLSICTYHLDDDKEVLEKIILDINPNYIIEQKYMKLYAYVPCK